MSLFRQVVVKPAMCGYNSLFAGQIGDWTWDTVSELCDVNAFAAYDASGQPAYLAFSYIRIRGARLTPRTLTFGDELTVLSGSYNCGSRSVHTLHRISPRGKAAADCLDPVEFFDKPDPDCLYAECFNRWVVRKRAGDNADLLQSPPPEFRYAHLPKLEDRYSPRIPARYAKAHLTFDEQPVLSTVDSDYTIDVTRDLNGVGLVYYASYFSIVDKALWQVLGRDDQAYLDTRVLDQQICYLGNVNVGTVLRLETTRRADNTINVVLRERETARVVAVSTLKTHSAGRD